MKQHVYLLAIVAASLAFSSLSTGCVSVAAREARTSSSVIGVRQYDKEWFDAAREGRWDILEALVDAKFPINATTPQGYTALILAAYNNHPDTVDKLLASGASACVGDRNGNTALMGALFKGYADVARKLMHTKCDINQTNNAGETALAFAALFGRFDLLPELVKDGADPNHLDSRGNSALQNVLAQGNHAAARALRAVGANY
ncbi:ankyrin repeat domain-containing protein [Paraburkholderia caribensis]|uniref:ankyrin repeat domain-containing protein n=1 Tax=Paraburkholderia caribensis TaxID=75105 RepID=UPI0034D2DB12